MTLVKMVKQTLFRTIVIGIETTVTAFAGGGREWAQFQIERNLEIYSQGTEWAGEG